MPYCVHVRGSNPDSLTYLLSLSSIGMWITLLACLRDFNACLHGPSSTVMGQGGEKVESKEQGKG